MHLFTVFSFGSAEKGQLGNGKTGEHIVTGGKTVFDYEWEPSKPVVLLHITYYVAQIIGLLVPVRGLEDKKVVEIACGQQHSIALDETGSVYTSHTAYMHLVLT